MIHSGADCLSQHVTFPRSASVVSDSKFARSGLANANVLLGLTDVEKTAREDRMKTLRKAMKAALTELMLILSLTAAGQANSRTLETRFSLSSDVRSEFSTKFPLLCEGRILIEAAWTASHATPGSASLTLVLIQPDGTEATRRTGTSILQLEHRASVQDIARYAKANQTKWIVKVLNDSDSNRREVSGTLRITVPAESRALEDTQFTLLGSGNAQEIPFSVPAPGRIEVDVNWEPDVLSAPSNQVALVVSLIHPGESRTYARRQGLSPIRMEQQVIEQALDRGGRWVVRVQNDTQTKVKGRLKITYTPSL